MRAHNTLSQRAAFFLCLVSVLLLCTAETHSQLVKEKGRFIGNALTSGLPIYSNFTTYWNQVTPGNAGKWGSVEGVRDSYDWTWEDAFYEYAMNNSMPFKHHCLIWGAQQPSWIESLDSAQQRGEVEEWINAVGARYPSMSMIDVVNEPFHQPPVYAHALGDSGDTGWDWVVTAFAWARQYCMKGTKLLINEYNVLHDNTVTTRYLALVDTLRARGLVDAIGVQGHYFEFRSYAGAPSSYTYSLPAIRGNLARLVATGLPVYITEFDINEANDSTQLENYKTYFPIFWENTGVKGITLWGYMQGDMWQTNGYLVRANGTERPALQWLRKYVATPIPPVLISPLATSGEPRNARLVWQKPNLASSYRLQLTTSRTFSTFSLDTTLTDSAIQLSPLSANTTYYWRVAASNDSGSSAFTSSWFITGDQILAVEEPEGTPQTFILEQNYPNPFNPVTNIRYQISDLRHLKLAVYDLLGQEVAVLVNEEKQPGSYSATWDARGLASGVYICRMTAGDFADSRKMVVVR